MNTLSLGQVLALLTWFPLAALIYIMLLIARFYQRFSGRRTYFRAFLIPIVMFGMASVRYASSERVTGDWIADLLLIVGGIVLIVLSLWLFWRMLIQRKPDDSATPDPLAERP